jgi:ribosomal protein S18 acetylase RimI-like enzyme
LNRAPKVQLRNATSADYNYLYKVFRATMKTYIAETRGEWSENREEAQFRAQLDVSASQIVLVDNSPVGFITVPFREDALWIHTICIVPEHQNRGIGTAVIESVITRSQEQQLHLHLSVLKVNPARRLYERLGFKVTHATTHHYQMKLDPAAF